MRLDGLFLPLLGSWTGTEEQAASPWSPATTARAGFTFLLDIDATVVVQDYRQVRADGQEFLGHGVFMLDPGSAGVLWWFFDSYGHPPEPATGAWADDALALTKVTPRGVARHLFRAAADRLEYTIGVAASPDAVLVPFLTGRYQRVSGH